MRTVILAFALSIPLLYTGPASAVIMSGPDFVQRNQNGTIDGLICDKVRYNLGVPKIDALADVIVADCVGRLSKIPDPRPVFCWQESVEEAQRICTAYTKRSRLDPESGMLLILDTRDFDKCMEKELP